MALQALAAYAAKVYSPQLNVSILITNGADKQNFEVTADNAMVLQSYQVAVILVIFSQHLNLETYILIKLLIKATVIG